jgi:isopentenyldiphosphate isomerase
MGIRNYLKKLGKRAAGSWGRINHPLQMRAESKAIRRQGKEEMELEIGADVEAHILTRIERDTKSEEPFIEFIDEYCSTTFDHKEDKEPQITGYLVTKVEDNENSKS